MANEKAEKFSSCLYETPQLNDGLQTGTLKDAEINETIITSMSDSITMGNYPNIHSVLILSNNKLVYEKYYPGTDVTRGIGNAGFKEHTHDSLHDIRSVSKSVVGTTVLLAIGQGKIKSVNQRVFDFFPEYAKYDTGMKRQVTIKHLLNMSAGLEWDEETISYADTANSERRMDNSPDAVDFVLRQSVYTAPGTKYNYSGGCTQILVAIVQKATGMQIEKFTEAYLFKPLGIIKYTWVKNGDGVPSGASGLRMRSRDMAKLGLVYLNNGKWNGKQVIPTNLVALTLKSQVSTPFSNSIVPHIGYSNQFWIPTEIINGKTVTWAQAQGNGGQIIIIDKLNNLVAVITAGNYNAKNLRKTSWDIYPDFIYPAVIGGSRK